MYAADDKPQGQRGKCRAVSVGLSSDEGDSGEDAHHADDNPGDDVEDIEPLVGGDGGHVIFCGI